MDAGVSQASTTSVRAAMFIIIEDRIRETQKSAGLDIDRVPFLF